MAIHKARAVTTLVRDMETDDEYVEVQIRCDCTDDLVNDYGVGEHIYKTS